MNAPLDAPAHPLAAARHHLRDLLRPDPVKFWRELILNSLFGWSTLVLAVAGVGDGVGTAVLMLAASFSLHRTTVFLHELSHLGERRMPRLRTAWNVLWGLPFLLPSWLYERMHLDHHRSRIYGSVADPEYSPLARLGQKHVMMSLLIGLFLPVALLLRFMLLTPLAWLLPPVRRLVDAHFSYLTANPKWVAPARPPAQLRHVRRDEVLCFIWPWSLAAISVLTSSPRLIAVPLSVMFAAMVHNQLRAHVAHRFERDGASGDETKMLADCLNVSANGPLESLLIPMGVGLHALHHLMPAIPFHNLPEAHARLQQLLPVTARYHVTESPGVMRSLRHLFASAARGAVPH